jgi:hypothetical protein
VHVLSVPGPMRYGLWISTTPLHVLRSYIGGERDGEREIEKKWGRRAPPAAAVWGQSERQGCAKKRRVKAPREGGGVLGQSWGFGLINKCRRSGRALTHFAARQREIEGQCFSCFIFAFFLLTCSLTVLEAGHPSFDPPNVTFHAVRPSSRIQPNSVFGCSAASKVIIFGNNSSNYSYSDSTCTVQLYSYFATSDKSICGQISYRCLK